jgi:hypothetical protein|tara:strand:+ start:250 stop:630 length:381 start_codon:yes stop_codon:yes gene_type:complete
MNKEIELIDLEEVKYIYKAVTNIGRHKDSPIWFYLAKLTPESFVRLWQRCSSMDQFQASYQALGGGICTLDSEEAEPAPEESVYKILSTVGFFRKKGIQLSPWDISEDNSADYWDSLNRVAEEQLG